MANTTTTEVSHAVNNYYQRTMLMRAIPVFVHTRFGRVYDIPQGNTQTIKFRRYTNLTAATTALTEGVTPNGSQLAVTDITSVVGQYGDFVTLTDVLQWATLDPLLIETSNLLGDQVSDSLDQICRNVIVAGSTVQYAGTATTRATVAAGMILNYDEAREAVRTLKGNNAKQFTRAILPGGGFGSSPVPSSYWGICSHNTVYDLKADPSFVPVEEYSSQMGVVAEEVGKLDEIRFVQTTNAKTFSSTVTVHATLVIAQEAYAITRISGKSVEMITKPLGSGGTTDPLNQISTMGWKAIFVAKILNDNFILRIEHAVSS